MSHCITKIPHEKCGSKDNLQVFLNDDGTTSGYCFTPGCHTYVPDPLSQEEIKSIPKTKWVKKSKEEIEAEIEEINKLPAIDLDSRSFKAGALDYFGIKVGYSEEDGKTPHFVHFPYTKNGKVVRYKTRILEPKRMWAIGTEKDVDLFGWQQAIATGAKRLIITEGEFDAVALTKILKIHTKPEYANSMPAVVSIGNGAGGAAKEIQRNIRQIRTYFNDVSLCFDQDEHGKEAVDQVCKLFPEFKVINLPAKDANYCLQHGLSQAVYKAVTFNTTKNKNTKLVWGRDVHEAAKEKAEWGLSWPWAKMTELTRGIRYGETIYIAAGEKLGKSEMVNAIAAHLVKVHGLKVLMAKPEEANKKTYKLLAGKVVGKIFHDPKVDFDEDAYESAGRVIKDNMCMLDLYQNITWDVLRADIQTAVSEGVKAVFIDPITNLTNGMGASEANEFLQGFAQELAVLAKDLNIVIFCFAHLNKPAKGNTPWDRGGKVTTDYFAGSSGMARSCNYAMAIQGNKDPELPIEQRNLRELVILADREYGESGSVKLYWDYHTGLFNQAE